MSCLILAWETCCSDTEVANLANRSVGEAMLEEGDEVKLEKPVSVARAFRSRLRVVGRLGGSMFRKYV